MRAQKTEPLALLRTIGCAFAHCKTSRSPISNRSSPGDPEGARVSQEACMNASWKFTNGLLGFVVLLLVSVSACFAQSTATLAGTVTDPTGAVVPNASVKVRSLATNVIRETVSDTAGNYVVPSLQPGDYEIRTTAAGFGTSVIKSVTLQVDQSVTANVKLNVQSSGETVQEEAGAAPS